VILYHNCIIIPKLCLNSETWNLSTAELEEMEKIQNKSLKRMLRLPPGTPSMGLKAELGIMSIESIVAKRKMMFLHRLLNLPDSNITKRVLIEQEKMPGETWLYSTIKICRKLGLTENLETIKAYPKPVWKNQVHEAINKEETDKLIVWAENSKKYTSARLGVSKKKYINYLPPVLAVTILKVRTGMIEVKANYKNMHSNLLCRKCNASEEDLIHILRCNTKLSNDEDELVNHTTEILDNIEVEEPSKVGALARCICREIQKMKNRETSLVETSLESRPRRQAASEEEDTY
jgi:hypothetical protein